MIHTFEPHHTVEAVRWYRPNAAIIRRTEVAVLAFDRAEEAHLHETAQVMVPQVRS